nr:MAG TPA: hypothetical protein [Caudoviricetes sp.]
MRENISLWKENNLIECQGKKKELNMLDFLF